MGMRARRIARAATMNDQWQAFGDLLAVDKTGTRGGHSEMIPVTIDSGAVDTAGPRTARQSFPINDTSRGTADYTWLQTAIPYSIWAEEVRGNR